MMILTCLAAKPLPATNLLFTTMPIQAVKLSALTCALIALFTTSMRADAVWENSTTRQPVKVEFGPAYTMQGDVRVQKIYTSEETQFPHVFVPDAPMEVFNDGPYAPALPEKPMRIVVLRTHKDDKATAKRIEQAEGKHVEITFRLMSISDELLEPIGLLVEKIKILGDATNSG